MNEKDLSRIEVPVCYTGRSPDAALATLAASLRPPQALYCFGTPRVGDRDFVAAVESVNFHRIAPANHPYRFENPGLAKVRRRPGHGPSPLQNRVRESDGRPIRPSPEPIFFRWTE